MNRHLTYCIALLLIAFPLRAEEKTERSDSPITVTGSLQHSGLFALEDTAIGAAKPDFPYLSNSYLDLAIRSRHVSGGLRGELMLKPLPGFDESFAGAGVSNIWIQTHWDWGNITLGDVYGQFGSGLILRLYEDRNLGVDNALRGGKIDVTPYRGIRIEALGGKQRRNWQMYRDDAWGFNYRQDALLGANLELQVDEWSPRMQEAGASLTLGGSWVSKYQQPDTIIADSRMADGYLYTSMYNLPRWVGAWDTRAAFQMKGWSALVEYAYKANDPCQDNRFSYAKGDALLLSLSYSQSGMAILVQAKRSENMAFRSERLARGNVGMINYLPAFTTTHTYALAALNSYATQMGGEWAFQGEIRYTWKRKTRMGGKYGTTLKLSAGHVRGLGSGWFGMSKEPYYTDINIELNKKLTKQWSLNAMLMYQTYNKQVVEGHGALVRSGIAVADVKWAINSNVQMRAELQYLFSKQEEGQWIHALYELSLFRQLMITLSDTYNIGGTDGASHHNYYQAHLTYQHGAHRLMAGFCRTMAGYNCAGGVCRYVPAQKGVTLSYSYAW